MHLAKEFKIPAPAKTIPAGYESFVRRGRVVLEQWTAMLHVARVYIQVHVSEKVGCAMRAVGKESSDNCSGRSTA